MTWSSIWHI